MIGVTSGAEGVWLIRGTLPYDCIDDAFGATEPITIGVNAPTPADLGPFVSIGWLADRFDVPLVMRNVPAADAALLHADECSGERGTTTPGGTTYRDAHHQRAPNP